VNDLQFPNVWLTDLNTVLRHRSNANNSADWSTDDLDLLADFIEQASADIVGELGWLPLPYVDTLRFDWSSDYISRDSKELWLSGDACLLAITTLTNGDTEVLSDSYYVLQPNNRYPVKTVRLLSGCGKYFKAKTGGQWEQAISIAGIWGYVPHYEYCWQDTGYTVQNTTEITSTDTTLEVGTGNGANFSRGEYLQLEDETVFVAATDDDEITIVRAQLGTTAAAHAEDTVISRYIHENIIKRACTEWAAFLYNTKDQLGQQVQTYDNGLSIVNGLSPTVYRALMKRQRVVAGNAG
jgi:hypothetical protein